MTCMELVVVILAIGFVTMIEVCVIFAGVSKMIDAKTKARVELTTTLFKNEMEYIDKLFDKYMTRIENMIDKCIGNKG